MLCTETFFSFRPSRPSLLFNTRFRTCSVTSALTLGVRSLTLPFLRSLGDLVSRCILPGLLSQQLVASANCIWTLAPQDRMYRRYLPSFLKDKLEPLEILCRFHKHMSVNHFAGSWAHTRNQPPRPNMSGAFSCYLHEGRVL